MCDPLFDFNSNMAANTSHDILRIIKILQCSNFKLIGYENILTFSFNFSNFVILSGEKPN